MRKPDLFILLSTIFLYGVFACLAQTTALVHVNVVPMDRERILKDQTVIIRDGLIAEIGDAAKVKVPKGALRIDAEGKYLMPGLVDMHTHLLSDDEHYPKSIGPDELRVMIANGVTTCRFMIGTPDLLDLKKRSAAGSIIGPTIWVASPHLTGREQGNDFVVNTPEEAREAVRKSKAAGYDFIKFTTFVKADVYEAAVDEAAKLKIRVVGHADSRYVGVARALKAHQQIEHLDGYLEMLLSDDAPMKGSVSDLYIYNPKNWESIDHIDESKIAKLAADTVASNPFVDPTQSFMKNTFGLPRSEGSIRAQPDLRFYPPAVQKFYIDYMKRTPLNQVSWEKRARWVEIRNKMIKAIYDAGGKLMTGSDTPEFLWLYGFTMPRELKALSDAGVPNYAVLEAATRNAHEYLGSLSRSGTVEKGKEADLILLNDDPLLNVEATKMPSAVILKGKFYPRAELDKWLDEIAPKISNSYIEKKADARAQVFGKDVISSGEVFRGVFAPDGRTFYFFKKVTPGQEDYRIFTSEIVDGAWSAPTPLLLGGKEYSDLYPAISKDGKRLVFASYRPAPGAGFEKKNAYLWYSVRTESGWSDPVFLAGLNTPEAYHSWAGFGPDDNLYFRRTSADWKDKKDLVARWNGSGFDKAEPFDAVEQCRKLNPSLDIAGGSPGPTVDIVLLDVSTKDPVSGGPASDIYFSRRKEGKWSEPRPFSTAVNKEGFETFPFFTPNGKTMVFVRDFKEFYYIDFEAALEASAQ